MRHLVTIFAVSVSVNLEFIAEISNAEFQPRIYIINLKNSVPSRFFTANFLLSWFLQLNFAKSRMVQC